MADNVWQLQDAKAKFSQLVRLAIRNIPQVVTKHGNNAVVLLSFEEYQKLIKPKKDLIEFFKDSPLYGLELDLERSKDLPRDIDL